MIREDCSLIGYISKAHGIDGQLMVRTNSNFADDIEPGEPLFVKVDELLVPFFIEEAEVYPDRAIVKLEFIDNPEEARKFTGLSVYLEKQEHRPESAIQTDNFGYYTGYSFRDNTSGIEGIIREFIDNPLNPLFLVENGASEFLVPVHPDFIVEEDNKRKLLVFNLPEGIADI
ncbi:MAG: hypothetical protein H6538_00640 [Bacteroidales bacterium]|nr:hypothetical protein [Bacteroidales bacterium]MCB8998582.1 hypothetical protein [Bacteroidales bacterium]MCB9012550.1 hypothetical protein [Bacteroidales bacterium]